MLYYRKFIYLDKFFNINLIILLFISYINFINLILLKLKNKNKLILNVV